MKRTYSFVSIVLACGMLLSACAGLGRPDEPISGEFGPQYTPKEHQQRTFDALWEVFSENYIYYDSVKVDFDGIRAEYQAQIETGLSNDEFATLLNELENDLPAGSFTYQSRTERIETDTVDNSTYQGIGAYVGFQAEEKPHIVVLAVIEGSPAEQAGIRAHDSIFAIDGTPVSLAEGINAVQRVRGPAGSTVSLQVQTPGKPERSVEVTRGTLVSTSKIEARELENGYGYILFPTFPHTTLLDNVLATMQNFTSNKRLNGLILDLRVAGGTEGWPLQEFLTLFYDGEVGEYYNNVNQNQPVAVQGEDFFSSQNVPLIILVSEHTTGSAEVFTASLQANRRATVIGETTTGSIETAFPFFLPDGSRIFVETVSFRLPNGDTPGITGVIPDFLVDAGWDDISLTNDPVLKKALEVLAELAPVE